MLKVNELFSGIGAFRKALVNLKIPHEIVGISEIDKYAVKSYEAIYGQTKNYGDISKVSSLDYADLWTYGFPCQDISVAGLQQGIVKNETRSGLLYEVKRLLVNSALDNELPQYLIMENVKNLVGKKFKADFDNWLNWLSRMGYRNYYQVMNAKNYGIPHKRERVIVVSTLGDKDFTFPEKQELKLQLTDLLENDVDRKYYLSQNTINMLLKENTGKYPRRQRFLENITKEDNLANTILTRQRCAPTDNFVKTGEKAHVGKIELNAKMYSLRRLTPKECWRLMGFDDVDYIKASKVCSDAQLYKQAGNSIVVNVLERILEGLLYEDYNL